MSFVTATNRLLFSNRLFFTAFVLIAMAGLALGESAALSASYRQMILSATAGVCVTLAFAALVLELLERAERLERQARELADVGEALRESEARLLDFALTSSDWFWETDSDHRLTYASDGIRSLGFNPESCVGRTHWELDLDAESGAEKWRDHVATLERREVFRDVVYTSLDDQRSRRNICISGRPVFDPSGQFHGYRGTARDVTEKLAADYKLHEAMRAAERANVAKSNFLANMNHELRTPLNAILGFSEMLSLGTVGSLQPRIRDYVEVIHKSARHLLDVVSDVLDFATIEAGKIELLEEEFHPSTIINTCVEIVSGQAQARGLKIAIETSDADLPSIRGDERRLRQVLLNPLSNAIKFSHSGGVIMVRALQLASGAFAFQVQDHGPGMTTEEMAIALERFGQVDAGLERRHEGTGLGLPLARSLIELHGGALQIDSEKGRGTTVTVTLPPERVIPKASSPVDAAQRVAARA
jgi:two-component system cell cycle sensor histidine kinase PleC